MDEVSHTQILLQELEKRERLAEDYKELRDNQAFKDLFLQGYLGSRYSKLGDAILTAVGRGEDCDEAIQEFRALHKFKEYLSFLEQGEKSWLYQDLYTKMEAGTLAAEEVTQRLGALRNE